MKIYNSPEIPIIELLSEGTVMAGSTAEGYENLDDFGANRELYHELGEFIIGSDMKKNKSRYEKGTIDYFQRSFVCLR